MPPHADSAPPSELRGRTLGHFRIEAQLAEGGMGVVYRALDERLHRHVALKLLPRAAMRDEASRLRLLREARAAAAVTHANVAAVYEVGESDGYVYIAMELVEGRSLRELLAAGPLPLAQAVSLARPIAHAMGRAHDKGIVHRDLKPENVMVSHAGEVKVLDFGIAKLLDPGPSADDLASRDQLVGTPPYMSPEQATGNALDARTDVFSFGVLLYEMLTGQRPFGGTTSMEILVAIARDAPRDPSTLVALPAEVTAILDGCLAKRPADRFANGRALAAALDAFDASRHPVAHLALQATELAGDLPSPASVTRALSARSRRGRLVAAAGTLALALAAAGGVALGLRRPGTMVAPTVAPSAPALPAAPPPAKPEAEALLARADREDRAGRHDLACADYARASDADPGFAQAALETCFCYSGDPRVARPYYRRAWDARATLPAAGAALLEAVEPIYQRDPIDQREALARLREAERRFPDAPRIRFEAARQTWAQESYERSVPEYELAFRLDPGQPRILEVLADNANYSGDFARGQATIEQCLKVAPGELGCLEERAWVDGLAGRCGAMEVDARGMLAVDPTFGEAAQILANALYAQGSSASNARELLRRRRENLPEGDRELQALGDEARVSLLTGDFAAALGRIREWEDRVKASTRASDHGEVARMLVLIEVEMGRLADAASDAAAYLDARDAWDPDARFDDWAMAKEPTPYLLATRLHAGAITQATFERDLARSFERWRARAVPHLTNFVWIWTFVVPAETPEEARAALDRPGAGSLPPFTPLSLVGAELGRVYALAGRAEEAARTLERATADCSPVDHPIEHTRAHYFLGEARESLGDRAGACQAYGVVLERWGAAKPRSTSADKARARMAVLGCGARHG